MDEDYYPVCCHLLSNDTFDSNQEGFAPYGLIKRQIEFLSISKVYWYCALCLLALFDGEFDEDIFSEMACSQKSSKLTDVVKSCGLSVDEKTFREIRISLHIMEEIYVIKDHNGIYQFLHELIYYAVASIYGHDNILLVIQHFSPVFLRSRIRIAKEDFPFGQIKLITKHFTRFAERICKDLQQRYIINVFTNPSILNIDFQMEWQTALLNYPNNERISFVTNLR